jgi:hypothetical protein
MLHNYPMDKDWLASALESFTLYVVQMLRLIFHQNRAVYTRLKTMPDLERRLVRKLGMWT